MATPTAAVPRDHRSGGKMVRARRPRLTPYDRPPPPASPDSGRPDHTPGWLSRLVLSPTRLIATGAGKVLASVFGSDSASESSSDSGDPGSEEDVDDVSGEDCQELSPEVADQADQNQASQVTNSLIKEPHIFEWRSETKHVIAQLLMQETFSREECARLKQIIESRVADTPITEVVESDIGVSDLRNTAVIEAKRWIEEKKSVPGSKSDLDHGMCTLNTFLLPNVVEVEMGSPVDLAKSYMQARPPWASPAANHVPYSSCSPTLNGPQLFKEESLNPFSGSTSKLHKESPLSGSWSILEELRKVRSRATEELLKTRPSSKNDWASLSMDYKRGSSFSTGDQVEAVSLIAYNGSREAIPPSPDTSIPGKIQDVEVATNCEGRGELSIETRLQDSEAIMPVFQSDAVNAAGVGPKDNTDDSVPLNAATDRTGQDSRFHGMNGSIPPDASERGADVANNGFPSGSSLSGEEGKKEKSRPSAENENGVSMDDELKISVPVEETCNFLSEYLLEVPVTDQNNNEASMSQNSSSTHQEERLSRDQPRSNPKRSLAGKPSDVEEKQQARKVSRYNRRGRGRGK